MAAYQITAGLFSKHSKLSADGGSAIVSVMKTGSFPEHFRVAKNAAVKIVKRELRKAGETERGVNL